MNPIVSVIIPFHLNEHQNYLDLCLESLRRQYDIPFEVLVVASSTTPPTIPQDERFKLVYMPEHKHYAPKINKGVEMANPNSKYFLLGSDDIIFSTGSVKMLAETCADNAIILNPHSNCDYNWLYFGSCITSTGLLLKKQMRMDEIAGHEESLYNFSNPYDITMPVSFNCFYATIIPRKVWMAVGNMDEGFKTGKEDLDYCLRASRQGINSMMTFRTFVFHFSGVTADKSIDKEERESNEKVFQSKWKQ